MHRSPPPLVMAAKMAVSTVAFLGHSFDSLFRDFFWYTWPFSLWPTFNWQTFFACIGMSVLLSMLAGALPTHLVLLSVMSCTFCYCSCICGWIRRHPGPPPLLMDEERPLEEPEFDASVACPVYWEAKDCSQHFDERYDVPKKVKKAVQDLVNETWKDKKTRDRTSPMPKGIEVVNVQRIEDRKLWASYVEQKRSISSARGATCERVEAVKTARFAGVLAGNQGLDVPVNEHYLFHGTSPEGAMGISEDGFRLALSGSKTGSMFGKGAYFAEASSKADEYANEGAGIYRGIYAMLLCRVCCGKMRRMLKRNDEEAESVIRSGAYDSILGDRETAVGTYREFVVFRERQIYPEYVVLYKRVYPDSEEEGEHLAKE